ncbi:unnamed protein product, partial [Scytosiphon promiscuus]
SSVAYAYLGPRTGEGPFRRLKGRQQQDLCLYRFAESGSTSTTQSSNSSSFSESRERPALSGRYQEGFTLQMSCTRVGLASMLVPPTRSSATLRLERSLHLPGCCARSSASKGTPRGSGGRSSSGSSVIQGRSKALSSSA